MLLHNVNVPGLFSSWYQLFETLYLSQKRFSGEGRREESTVFAWQGCYLAELVHCCCSDTGFCRTYLWVGPVFSELVARHENSKYLSIKWLFHVCLFY